MSRVDSMLSSRKRMNIQFKSLYPNQLDHLQVLVHHLRQNNQNSMCHHHDRSENNTAFARECLVRGLTLGT